MNFLDFQTHFFEIYKIGFSFNIFVQSAIDKIAVIDGVCV